MADPLSELRKRLTDWQILRLADLLSDLTAGGTGELTIKVQSGSVKYFDVHKSIKVEDNTTRGIDKLENMP